MKRYSSENGRSRKGKKEGNSQTVEKAANPSTDSKTEAVVVVIMW